MGSGYRSAGSSQRKAQAPLDYDALRTWAAHNSFEYSRQDELVSLQQEEFGTTYTVTVHVDGARAYIHGLARVGGGFERSPVHGRTQVMGPSPLPPPTEVRVVKDFRALTSTVAELYAALRRKAGTTRSARPVIGEQG